MTWLLWQSEHCLVQALNARHRTDVCHCAIQWDAYVTLLRFVRIVMTIAMCKIRIDATEARATTMRRVTMKDCRHRTSEEMNSTMFLFQELRESRNYHSIDVDVVVVVVAIVTEATNVVVAVVQLWFALTRTTTKLLMFAAAVERIVSTLPRRTWSNTIHRSNVREMFAHDARIE